MNLKMRTAMGVFTALAIGSSAAHAQQYTVPGVWGGTQPCPYPQQMGTGASSYLDGYRELQTQLAKERANLAKIRKRQKQMAEEMETAEDVINGTINEKYVDMIVAHLKGQYRCSDYEKPGRSASTTTTTTVSREETAPAAAPAPAPNVDLPPGAPAAAPAPAERGQGTKPGTNQRSGRKPGGANQPDVGSNFNEDTNSERAPASVDEDGTVSRAPAGEDDEGAESGLIPVTIPHKQWAELCVRNKRGTINQVACTKTPYAAIRRQKAGSDADCRKALTKLANGSGDLQKFEGELAAAEKVVKRLEDEVDEFQATGGSSRSSTEAGFCAACEEAARRQRTQSLALGVGFGLAGLYVMNQERRDYNRNYNTAVEAYSNLGFQPPMPGSATSALGPGLIAAGVGTALSGGVASGMGSGAYGCAGNYGANGQYAQNPLIYGNGVPNNSAFAYPPSLFPQAPGGAMYNNGVGPWGPNGPWALNGTNGPVLLNNGQSIPYGAPIGRDAYGNLIYSQGGVPNAYANGQVYNPYAIGQNGAGYYGAGGLNAATLQNGAAGVTAQLLNIESANLASRQGALGIVGGGGLGFNQFSNNNYSLSQMAGVPTLATPGYVSPNYLGAGYANTVAGGVPRIGGSITIGGTYSTGGTTLLPTGSVLGGSSGVVIPAGTR